MGNDKFFKWSPKARKDREQIYSDRFMSIMAMITSHDGKELWPNDIVIKNLKPTNLSVKSIIRFKLFTLDHELILGRLGSLHDDEKKAVQERLREILHLPDL